MGHGTGLVGPLHRTPALSVCNTEPHLKQTTWSGLLRVVAGYERPGLVGSSHSQLVCAPLTPLHRPAPSGLQASSSSAAVWPTARHPSGHLAHPPHPLCSHSQTRALRSISGHKGTCQASRALAIGPRPLWSDQPKVHSPLYTQPIRPHGHCTPLTAREEMVCLSVESHRE